LNRTPIAQTSNGRCKSDRIGTEVSVAVAVASSGYASYFDEFGDKVGHG
jgi:hypothetical protein